MLTLASFCQASAEMKIENRKLLMPLSLQRARSRTKSVFIFASQRGYQKDTRVNIYSITFASYVILLVNIFEIFYNKTQ